MGFVFFKAVQGFKQNNIVHQQPQSQIASVQRLQPIPDASIGRALAEKNCFFVVFDRHSRAIADWEFPIAVALRSSSSKITHDHAIRVCATLIAIAIATFGALSKAMAILLFRGWEANETTCFYIRKTCCLVFARLAPPPLFLSSSSSSSFSSSSSSPLPPPVFPLVSSFCPLLVLLLFTFCPHPRPLVLFFSSSSSPLPQSLSAFSPLLPPLPSSSLLFPPLPPLPNSSFYFLLLFLLLLFPSHPPSCSCIFFGGGGLPKRFGRHFGVPTLFVSAPSPLLSCRVGAEQTTRNKTQTKIPNRGLNSEMIPIFWKGGHVFSST